MNDYNPIPYWREAGKTYYQDFKNNDVYFNQEVKLLEYLGDVAPNKSPAFESVLELGCGFGRITKVITDTFIIGEYVAVDVSPEQLSHVKVDEEVNLKLIESDIRSFTSRRKFDLVIAVEVLMHQLPSEVESIIAKMKSLSKKHVMSLDYYCEENVELAPHNFNHDYPSLYGPNVTMKRIGEQALFHCMI